MDQVHISIKIYKTEKRQRDYFTTSVTVLYELPLVAVLSITGKNNVIFRTFRQYQFRTLRLKVKYRTC